MTVLELPGVYLDALIEDAPANDILVINRSPEPGETGVAADAHVQLDIVALAGAETVVTASTRVYLTTDAGPEVLAYDGASGFQPGFGGPSSAATNPFANVLRIVVDLWPVFSSESVITIRVVSAASGGATIDQSYVFTVADTTPPRLEDVVATGLQTLELTFSEDVLMAPASSTDAAINASNYTIERLSSPAVEVEVSEVVSLSSSSVELTTDIPLTPGGLYRVTVDNVDDVLGNDITAPFDRLEFLAFSPPEVAGRSFDLYQLVPLMNRLEDRSGALRDFLAILQEPLDLVLYDIDRWQEDLLDPDTAIEAYLDAMLADLGNPFSFDLETVDKRRLVRVLVEMYKLKGTCVGIQNVVRFFVGVEVECDEYNDPETTWILGESELYDATYTDGGSILAPSSQYQLYSFSLISPVILTDTQREQIGEIAEYMKPAHTHYVALIEPTVPDVIDHLELGLSELGETWELH